MKLKAKILIWNITGVVAIVGVMLGLLLIQKSRLAAQVDRELDHCAEREASAICRDALEMVRLQRDTSIHKLRYDATAAQAAFREQGGAKLLEERIAWSAVNQFTQETAKIELPKMAIGEQWLGQNASFDTPSPLVDAVTQQTGDACTIFQRMNPQGDMLRICTSVRKQDGQRAIGTFIPAVDLNGKPNPVVSAVLKGETYSGRAYVVDAWCMTSYEPIRGADGEVIGMLYVGTPQGNVPSLRQALERVVVGKTGYVFILGGQGEQRGKYIISHRGSRDGEDIWNQRDAEGSLLIQSLVRKAIATAGQKTDVHRYLWKNKDEPQAREKLTAVTYYEPYDWVIGAGAYLEDFKESGETIRAGFTHLVLWVSGIAVIVLICSTLLSLMLAHVIVSPLRQAVSLAQTVAQGDFTQRLHIRNTDETGILARALNAMADNLQQTVRGLAENARTLADASIDLAKTSGGLTDGVESTKSQSAMVTAAAHEMSDNMTTMSQAAEELLTTIKSVAAATEEMTTSISQIAQSAEQAFNVASNASELAHSSNEVIGQLGTAADEIGKVIEVIQDIAEQTNLLALNATIEAARAGDAGKGFAVVATEVKELARQTGDATEDIRRRIEGIQESTTRAVQSIGEIGAVIDQVSSVSRTIASAMDDQNQVTREIARNIAEGSTAAETVSTGVTHSASTSHDIRRNIASVDQVAQQTADGAYRTQNASGKLAQMAEELQNLVDQFRA